MTFQGFESKVAFVENHRPLTPQDKGAGDAHEFSNEGNMKMKKNETMIKEVAKRHAPYWKFCYPTPMNPREMESDDEFKAWGAKECHDCAIEAIFASKMDENGHGAFTFEEVEEALPSYREAFLVELVKVLAA